MPGLRTGEPAVLARKWLWISALSGIASLLVYACAALLLHPGQEHAFMPERSPLAAAISNVTHGAPLGKVYSGALDLALDSRLTTEQFLEQATRSEVGRSKLLPNTEGGMGIGFLVVSDIGFRLFGIQIASIVYTMLAMMAVSAIALWSRFPDRRFLVVPLYFGALTAMLLTSLSWDPGNVAGLPVGGFRYFSLVAILPAFHLWLELFDMRPTYWSLKDNLALAVQVVILLIAVLVRNNAASLIGAVALGSLYCIWTQRQKRTAAWWPVVRKASAMALVGVMFVGILIASFSREYLSQGRFTETVWTRIVVSLGMHPGMAIWQPARSLRLHGGHPPWVGQWHRGPKWPLHLDRVCEEAQSFT